MQPIRLCEENPKYLSFRGRPVVLVTSASHYGAIINRPYQFKTELDELQAHGLNLVRIFGGHYREVPGDFGIQNNLLAPPEEDYISPFVFENGKYDLSTYNSEYFARLEEFVEECGRRGIVVEISLFCPFYHDGLWEICPFNTKNNVNDVEEIDRFGFHTLGNNKMLKLMETYITEIIKTVNRFDNVYFEMINEPWNTEIPLEFELHFARFIAGVEDTLSNSHLLARNPAAGWERIDYIKEIGLYNFHYASPPYAVKANEELPCAIGFNETGFKGSDYNVYRKQAWEFILSGGALFNNLDYSFAVGYESGTWYDANDPGTGCAVLRAQLGVLNRIINSIDLASAKPDLKPIKKCHGLHSHGLCMITDNEYVFYFISDNELMMELDIPNGVYELETVDVLTGETVCERVEISSGYRYKDWDFKKSGEKAFVFRKV